MTLAKEKIDMLRQSWAAAAPMAGTLLTRFYDTLFQMAPEAAQMFSGTDMEAQKGKLGAALGLVIREIETPGKILPTLQALGRRHAEMGVTAEDYDVVGAALISAFSETLGEAFDENTKMAWVAAYGTVASAMIAGGDYEQRRSA